MVKNPPAKAGDTSLIPGSGKPSGEGNDNPLQYSCLENLMGRGAWWIQSMGSQRVGHDLVTNQQLVLAYLFFKGLPGGSVGKESACNVGHLGSIPGLGDPLEKELATHSSTLAWKIPWTKEPSRLQSMGSQKVGHNSGDFTHYYAQKT